MKNSSPAEFDFSTKITPSLLVCAGGFEDRAVSFPARFADAGYHSENSILLHYESQRTENEPNYRRIKSYVDGLTLKKRHTVVVTSDNPIRSHLRIKHVIEDIALRTDDRTALVDISGMTNLLALAALHACLSSGLRTTVVYTEAERYFPSKEESEQLVRAWKEGRFDVASKYLQSSGLRAVHIPPDFAGNFRPGRNVCLMIFVGYEPNRIEGLVEEYAPGSIIAFYGRSPHKRLRWRIQLSQDLHEGLFKRWYVRSSKTSTLLVDEIVAILTEEFKIIQEQYDVAIVPQCSKMQAVAAYLFWRRHPEVQLVFTSPVSFKPKRYSEGSGRTFMYKINPEE
jgi:hypothetical protein